MKTQIMSGIKNLKTKVKNNAVMKATMTTVQRDLVRILAFIAVLSFMYLHDPDGFGVIVYMIGMMVLIALASHAIRRIIFHYLDMRALAKKAASTSMGAAVVFASVSFIIGMMYLLVSNLMH